MNVGWYWGDPVRVQSSEVKDAMDARIGSDILLPVYDQVQGQGSSFQYNVVGWASFRLTDYKFQGNGGEISGYFLSVAWEDADRRHRQLLRGQGRKAGRLARTAPSFEPIARRPRRGIAEGPRRDDSEGSRTVGRRMHTVNRRRGRGERGQTMTEFVIVLPIFLLLLLGIAQLGIAFNHYIQLTDATRAERASARLSTAAVLVTARTRS